MVNAQGFLVLGCLHWFGVEFCLRTMNLAFDSVFHNAPEFLGYLILV